MKPFFYSTSLLLLLAMGCSQESSQELSAQASQHYNSGDYVHAVKALQAINEEHGETPENWQNIAVAAYQSKDYSYAARAAQSGLTLLSITGEASTSTTERKDALTEILAMAREAEGNLEEAVRLYYELTTAETKAIKLTAKSRLANLFLEQNKPDAALALLLSAQKNEASNATTNYNLAKLCNETFMLHREALDFYRMADHFLPTTVPQKKIVASEIARLTANSDQLRPKPPATGNISECKKAIADYEKAKRKGHFKSAESYAVKALKADPSNYQAAINLITFSKQQKNSAVALETYHHALLINPTDLDLRVKAAAYALEMKRYDEALTFLRPVLVANLPKYKASIYQMMTILVKQGKRDEARAWGEYYLMVAPETPERNRTFIKGLPTYTK
ncbi:MAG: hypothetical protein Q4C03_03220 [bacterium]|nr:hypothetical protein [bacterium]